MEVRRSILLLLGCLVVLCGCRSGQQVAMLEQELRLQEDRIYQLQDCLEETRMTLDTCRQKNQSLRQCLGDEGGAPGRGRILDVPGDRPGSEIPKVPTDLNIETPPESQFQKQVPEMLRGSATPREPSGGTSTPTRGFGIPPGIEGPSSGGGPRRLQPRPAPAVPDRRPRQDGPELDTTSRSEDTVQIEIGELAVERTAVRRSESGEDGLLLVVVPRDGRGRPLPAAAPISVVVVDPAVPGAASRVARWDFSRQQAAARYRRSKAGEGFRLQLRWPRGGPAHKELHLFVRYTTSDGRKLHAEMPFDLGRLAVAEPQPAGRPLAQWQRKVEPPSGSSTSEAPVRDGPTVQASRANPSRRAARRLRRPVWSPERK